MRDRFLGIVAAILVLLAMGIAVWFYTGHESVQIEEEVGYHGLARVNPYLAAERTLELLGTPTDTWYAMAAPPDPEETVVVLSHDPQERERIHERLEGWAWSGGHIVAVAVDDPQDPFMADAGASVYWAQDEQVWWEELWEQGDAGGLEPEELEPEELEPEELDPEELEVDTGTVQSQGLYSEVDMLASLAETSAPGVRTLSAWDPGVNDYVEIQAAVVGSLESWREVDTWIQDEQGQMVAFSVPQGDGRLSILSDATWMSNKHIGEHDHAALLWSVTADDGPSKVILVARAGRDSLGQLILRHGWMVLLSAGVLLVGWAAFAAPRFGPMEPEPLPVRRSLLEHIQAAGAFHWRNGHVEALLAPARKAAVERVMRRYPELAGQQGVALVQGVARLEKMDEEHARELLYGQPKGAARFTQTVARLQSLGS